ncbi:MAG TPA: response regulator [Gammaproteobacteria bacterium]|nr:response regulator [Gammaproteobacteria bacterium]
MPIAKIHMNLKEVQRTIHRHTGMILDFIQEIKLAPLSEFQYTQLNFIKDTAEILRKFPAQLFEPDAPITINTPETGPWVLLVEDNEMLQLLHREMLTQLGCTVDIAANGEEALKCADQGYDFIFMDVGLPGKSGIEVTAELRAREEQQKLRIIALTAHGEGIEPACLAAGMESVIHKPVDLKTFKALIHSKAS